jgi:hypothetical protein
VTVPYELGSRLSICTSIGGGGIGLSADIASVCGHEAKGTSLLEDTSWLRPSN